MSSSARVAFQPSGSCCAEAAEGTERTQRTARPARSRLARNVIQRPIVFHVTNLVAAVPEALSKFGIEVPREIGAQSFVPAKILAEPFEDLRQLGAVVTEPVTLAIIKELA